MKLTTALTATSLCFIILLSNCNSSGSSLKRQKSPEELRMELMLIEQSRPSDYLSVTANYRENFWGDKFIITCTIINKASVAKYKDAIMRVIYYSKTETILGSKDYTIYELFSPNSSKTIELTVDNYQNVNSIGVKIIKALPVF